jgi:hypothetical protein
MKKEKKERKSKLDVFVTSVVQDWAHSSTEDIVRKRNVLLAEANAAEAEIHALTAKLIDVRARREKIDATLNGLAMVVETR